MSTGMNEPLADRLAVQTLGPDDALPVVLLHAFPLSRQMWRPMIAAFTERHPKTCVRWILMDLPGLGESPVPSARPSLAYSAEAVLASLDGLGIERAVVAGVSMGGYVVMELIRRDRARLAGVVLLDTKAEADDEAARANRERIAEAVTSGEGVRVLQAMVPALVGSTTQTDRVELVTWLRDQLAAAPAPGVAWSQRAMANRPDSHRDLEWVAAQRLPALVVVGEQDALSSPAQAASMAQTAGARLVEVSGAGHLAAVEAPEAVADALAAYLIENALA